MLFHNFFTIHHLGEHCPEPREFLILRQPSVEGDSDLTFVQASPISGTILVWGMEEKTQSLTYSTYSFPTISL